MNRSKSNEHMTIRWTSDKHKINIKWTSWKNKHQMNEWTSDDQINMRWKCKYQKNIREEDEQAGAELCQAQTNLSLLPTSSSLS